MFYREAGQFKTKYQADQAIFPILQDRWFICLVVVLAYFVVPFISDEYWLQAILIQFLIFSLAAIGPNILTGYAGQVSLGTGAFMAVGAYATYKITTVFPDINIVIVFLMSGVISAMVGSLFGLPSLKNQGLLFSSSNFSSLVLYSLAF